MLLFYNNRVQPNNYQEFLKITDQQIAICIDI